jgi:hypothetical protein
MLESDKPPKYMSNFIRGTTCRYHMPYVVADVVRDVAPSRIVFVGHTVAIFATGPHEDASMSAKPSIADILLRCNK